MQKAKIFFVSLFIALTVSLSAQEQDTVRRSLWIEWGGMAGAGRPAGQPMQLMGDFYLGVNRQVSDRASLGLQLEAYSGREQWGFNLTPNLSWRIPVTKLIEWTPRVYLSSGLCQREAPLVAMDKSYYAFELGVKPASFDVRLSKNATFNLTLNMLNFFVNRYVSKQGGGGVNGWGVPLYAAGPGRVGGGTTPATGGFTFSLPLPERFKPYHSQPKGPSGYLLE